MGTTLRTAIDTIGGGALPGRQVTAVLPGVSGSIIPAALLDTRLTYEDMAAIGSGLGSVGYIVLDDAVDTVAAVAGVSRFLAVESCGQCSPCKEDGLALSELLERLAGSDATDADIDAIHEKVGTVADGARCAIGTQHPAAVAGLLRHFPELVDRHRRGVELPQEVLLVAELRDINETAVELNESRRTKQPDWTFGPTWNGQMPVERFSDHRAEDDLVS